MFIGNYNRKSKYYSEVESAASFICYLRSYSFGFEIANVNVVEVLLFSLLFCFVFVCLLLFDYISSRFSLVALLPIHCKIVTQFFPFQLDFLRIEQRMKGNFC